MTKPTDIKEFLELAKEYSGNNCLFWPFHTVRGYGRIKINGKNYVVSRLICEHAYGPPPELWLEAAHSCGNGHLGCITRNHLRWATHSANQNDRWMHGTMAHGETHMNAKLTVDDVTEIRRLNEKHPQAFIADIFGISQACVSNIITRRTWKDG